MTAAHDDKGMLTYVTNTYMTHATTQGTQNSPNSKPSPVTNTGHQYRAVDGRNDGDSQTGGSQTGGTTRGTEDTRQTDKSGNM